MRVSWVLSEEIPTGLLDMEIVNSVSASWGSWKTWKEHKTENCICTDISAAGDLIKRAFHAVCTLYVPQDGYVRLGNPLGVKLFDGSFSSSVSNKDDIVALNLASPNNDIVLMSGFNLTPLYSGGDEKERIAREEYYFNIRALIQSHSTTQFVLVDYDDELAGWAKDLENLTVDTIESVKTLLV